MFSHAIFYPKIPKTLNFERSASFWNFCETMVSRVSQRFHSGFTGWFLGTSAKPHAKPWFRSGFAGGFAVVSHGFRVFFLSGFSVDLSPQK